MQLTVLRDKTPCSLEHKFRHFRGTFYLSHQLKEINVGDNRITRKVRIYQGYQIFSKLRILKRFIPGLLYKSCIKNTILHNTNTSIQITSFVFVNKPSSEFYQQKVTNCTWHRTHTKYRFLNVYYSFAFHRHKRPSANTSTV